MTIRIDDELYRLVKAKAARANRTVAESSKTLSAPAMVERAAHATTELSPLPTAGSGGTLPGVDLTSTSNLLDVLDEDAFLVARRSRRCQGRGAERVPPDRRAPDGPRGPDRGFSRFPDLRWAYPLEDL